MAEHLASAGHHVTMYSRHAIRQPVDQPNIESVVADLRDTWKLTAAVENADIVYHFASATYPSLFYTNPSAEFAEAVQPLLMLMEVAAQASVKKMVFPSSGGTIYAESSAACTEQSPTDPRSPYAIFKLASEELLHHAARLGQFSVDVFRIGNPFGPRQRARPGQGVIAHWIEALKSGQPIKIFGDGTSRRDYVYVDDVCRLMALSCDRIERSDTFNIGTGIGTSLDELAETIQACAGSKHDAVRLPGRESDIQSIVLSPQKILSEVPGFQFTTLADGIRSTLQAHGLN